MHANLKKKTHKEGSAADPGRRQLPGPEEETGGRRTRCLRREHSIRAEWRRQAGSQAWRGQIVGGGLLW